MIGFTKSLGKELAGLDIAVNCVTPAAARTRIFDQMSEEFIAFMLTKIPRGRFVEVEEIASLVAWLCVRGKQLHDRRGVRRFGRTRDVLSLRTWGCWARTR